MYKRYREHLAQLEEKANLRKLPGKVPADLINLSSNDYLGLNADQDLKHEFLKTVNWQTTSLSAASSRLLTGDNPEYKQLETTIASAYGRQSCLIFNSGYHANIGILPALATKKDLILADKLVHASIIDGMKLSQAEIKRYNHMDYKHLQNLLEKYRNEYDQVFIVTESIFSMDGDLADLELLVKLKNEYKCLLYVDEAHSVGVRGTNGLGLVEETGLIQDVDFIVGTFGKALASTGAFVVCDEVIREYLVNCSRSLIFTTALPPINLAWSDFVFRKLPFLAHKREQLHQITKLLADSLQVSAQSHILPFIIGANEDAIACAQKLGELGFHVMPIRQPTVPAGTARLRLSLHANLKAEQLLPLIEFMKSYAINVDQACGA